MRSGGVCKCVRCVGKRGSGSEMKCQWLCLVKSWRKMKGVCVGRGWGRKEDEVGSGAVIVFLFFFFFKIMGRKEGEGKIYRAYM